MQFGKDGNLYVVSPPTSYDQILRFDGASGSFIDIPIATGSGIGPETAFIAFDQQGNLYVGSEYANEILRNAAGPLVSLSEPALAPITVEFSTAGGTAFQGSDYAGVTGMLTFAPGETSKRILVSPVDDGVDESSESFTINLSNSDGATIADGQGVVTILNTQTKFFVVDDGAMAPTGPNVSDKTFEYDTGGTSVVTNVLTFANTAPRGVASNLAGTRLWVIDANKTVHVYDNRNALLGSWTAGGLNPSAQVEGIATNGTDIWIVDAKQDKVFRYAGTASRLSGSQNAASNFSLNSGNKNPKDIVTDGTSIWVVNDSTTDKVFKYNLSGTFLGSWTFDPANSSPTGLTINPANVSDIWIVDNGTDKVYQYTNAASRTSGSQNAAATFALNPSNTNPQGIADPPPPEMMESSAADEIVELADDDTGLPSPQTRRSWAMSLRTWLKAIGRR